MELFQKSLSLNKDLKVKFWPEFSGELAAIKNGGSYVHTAILEMDNQQGSTVSTGDSAQCYMAAWMGGEFRGECIHVYMYG